MACIEHAYLEEVNVRDVFLVGLQITTQSTGSLADSDGPIGSGLAKWLQSS